MFQYSSMWWPWNFPFCVILYPFGSNLSLFFGCPSGLQKIMHQGSNPHQSCNTSQGSDNAGSSNHMGTPGLSLYYMSIICRSWAPAMCQAACKSLERCWWAQNITTSDPQINTALPTGDIIKNSTRRSFLWHRSLRIWSPQCHVFDPWPWNFHMKRVHPKREKENILFHKVHSTHTTSSGIRIKC